MICPYNSSFKVTSPYGMRSFGGVNEFHRGIDLVGSSKYICSVCPGAVGNVARITDRSNPTWQWGLYVRVDSPDGHSYYYCHLSDVFVRTGQRISLCDHIGIEGDSGYCTGVHLHLEARKGRESVDISSLLGITNKVGFIEYEPRALVREIYGFADETMAYLDGMNYSADFYNKILQKR